MPKSNSAAPAKPGPPGSSSTANQPAPSDETKAPIAGQGMPAKDAQEPQSSQAGRQITPKDAAVEASLELPSDRDQSTDMTDRKSTRLNSSHG